MTAGLSLARATGIPEARAVVLKVTVPVVLPPAGVRHTGAMLTFVSDGAWTTNCADLRTPSGLDAEILAVVSVATNVVVIVKLAEVLRLEMVIEAGTFAAA